MSDYCWKPDEEEMKWVDGVLGMTVDSKLGRGVATGKTFVMNLRLFADGLELLLKTKEATDENDKA